MEAVVSGPLTPDLLDLAEEIAIRYRAPIGTTLAAMLPPGIESRLERRWELLQPEGDAAAGTVLTEPSPSHRPPGHAPLGREPAPGRCPAGRLASPATAGRASAGAGDPRAATLAARSGEPSSWPLSTPWWAGK